MGNSGSIRTGFNYRGNAIFHEWSQRVKSKKKISKKRFLDIFFKFSFWARNLEMGNSGSFRTIIMGNLRDELLMSRYVQFQFFSKENLENVDVTRNCVFQLHLLIYTLSNHSPASFTNNSLSHITHITILPLNFNCFVKINSKTSTITRSFVFSFAY